MYLSDINPELNRKLIILYVSRDKPKLLRKGLMS